MSHKAPPINIPKLSTPTKTQGANSEETKPKPAPAKKPGFNLPSIKLPVSLIPRVADPEPLSEERAPPDDFLGGKPGITKLDLGQVSRAPKPNVYFVKPPNTQGKTSPLLAGAKLPPGIEGISHRFSVGFADMCGTRDTMEDKMVIKGQFRGRVDEDFFAVFDGHSGSTAALFAAQNLYKKLETRLEAVDDDPFACIQCLHDSFLDCHSEMKQAGVESGTTGIISYFQRDRFFIANVGDSRVVVSQGGAAKALSIDQKPIIPSEKKRILKLGGWVTATGRVMSKLTVARALGDFPLNPYVCCEPEVFGPWYFSPDSNGSRDSHNFDFMILACDGLWDVCTNDTAVRIVHGCLTPEESAVKLRTYAFDQSTRDNVSIIVIFFPGYTPLKYKHLEFIPEPEPEEESETTSSESSPSESSSEGSEDSEESS